MPRVKIYLPKSDAAPEVRRWQITSYQDLQKQLADILGMSLQAGKLEYRDDEHDWVVLSNESEWDEAVLTLGESAKVLQLRFTAKQKKTPPMPPQRKSSTAQSGAGAQQQQQTPSFLGSLPQRAMHQVSNLEDYFKKLHSEQQMQDQQQRKTPQSAASPQMLQQMFHRPTEMSSQEIQPPQSPQTAAATPKSVSSPLTRSPLTRQHGGAQQAEKKQQQEQHHETIHIPFEDFLRQFGGKILGLVHPTHQAEEQQKQAAPRKTATPNSALPKQPTHAFFQHVQPKARSHSDSSFRNSIPRIILHPAGSMIGNAYTIPPKRSTLTTTAPSDLPLSRDEAANPHNLENIHKEEREERQQVESMAQTPKEMTPLPTKEDLAREQRERFLQDPHLQDLSSEEMDFMLDAVLDHDEAKLARKLRRKQQQRQQNQQDTTAVAEEAAPNAGPVKLSNEDARVIARPQLSSPFVPTAPEGVQSPARHEVHYSSEKQEADEADSHEYEHTMKLLENIGFENKKLNQHLLRFHKGNVNDTIHALLKLSQQEDEHH